VKSHEIDPSVGPQQGIPRPADDETGDDGRGGLVPIAVSEGDFSTPTKRKRTITRPRGLRALERVTPPIEPTVATPPEAPPLAPNQLPTGASPNHALAEARPSIATPPRVETPPRIAGTGFIVPDELSRNEASVVDEFLAAPPTPEPEIERTPAPEPSFLVSAESLTPIEPFLDPIENGAVAIEMRQAALLADGHTDTRGDPESDQDGRGQNPAPAILGAESGSKNPDPHEMIVDVFLDRDTSQLLSSIDGDRVSIELAPTPAAPRPEFSASSSASVGSTVGASESVLSPLAQTLANMAEAMQDVLVSDPTVDIDIADAPLLPLPSEALTQPRFQSFGPRTPPPPPAIDAPGSVEVEQSAGPRLSGPVMEALPEALAERPRRPKRSKPWFEEVFDESYLRTLPFMTAEQTLREVDFIESSLGVPTGGEVLDVACGYGRHAIELVQRGLAVTGLDLSLPLLIRAADESQRRAVSVNFVHTDMREIAFERQFDGAYCMLTSFGYFDEESNLKVAEGIARALKPGGRFLLDVVNRDYIVGDLPARIWWEGDGCVVLEEVDFNFNTNRILTHRSVVFEDGQQLEQEISVRVYSLHEMGKLLRQAGFRVLEVSGSIPTRGHFFGANSRNLLILAERRTD
jgi:SAM-dependent methyltransferase